MSHTDTLSAAERMRRSRARRRGEYVEPAPRIQRADAVKAEATRSGKSRETVYRLRRLTRNATAHKPAEPAPAPLPAIFEEKAVVSANGVSNHPAHLPAARSKAAATMARKRADNPSWGQRENKAVEHARMLALGLHRPLDSEPALPDLIIGDDDPAPLRGPLYIIPAEEFDALGLGSGLSLSPTEPGELLDKARATLVTLNDFADDTAGAFETRYFQVPIPPRIHNALIDGDMPRGPEFDAYLDALLDVPWSAVAGVKTSGVPMVGDAKTMVRERLIRLFAGLMIDDPAFFRWRQRVAEQDLNRRASEYSRKVRKIRRVRIDEDLGSGWEETGGLKFGIDIGWWDRLEGGYVTGARAATEGEQLRSTPGPRSDVWGWRLLWNTTNGKAGFVFAGDRTVAEDEQNLRERFDPDAHIQITRVRTLLHKGGMMLDAWRAGWKEQTAFEKREARRRTKWFGEKYVETLPPEVKADPVTRGEIMAAYVEGSEDYLARKPVTACPYAASGFGYNAWRKGYEEEKARAERNAA